jgi:predicted ATP-grasp superfamily ATP-dependent carboligase
VNLSHLIEAQHDYVASIPNQQAAETLVSKKKFYQSLEEQGVPHPTTCYPDQDGVLEIARKLSFPIFIKPIISPTFQQQFRRKGFVAYDVEELDRYVQFARERGFRTVVQEIIIGPPSNHFFTNGYFDTDTQLKHLLTKQRLRVPSFFNDSSAMVSIPVSQHMAQFNEVIVEYLTSLKYHGCFSVEFKLDARDHTFKIIEVNARTTWYNSHDTACGLNMVLTAYREAVGEPIETRMQYEPGVYTINTVRDIQSMRAMLIKGTLSLGQVLASYTGKKHLLIYARDDPMPYIKRPHIEIKKRPVPTKATERMRCTAPELRVPLISRAA